MTGNTSKQEAKSKPKALADVIEALSQHSGLDELRRRDLISACNSVARLSGQETADISCDVPTLRQIIVYLHHVQGRITRKRLANIRADVAAALEVTGLKPPSSHDVVMSCAWKEFLAKTNAKHQAYALARFARFCSAQNIDPDSVDDNVLQRFKEHLDERILINDPAKIALDTAKNFNAIVKRANLSFGKLNASRGNQRTNLPLTSYPASLQADIDRYIRRLEKPDLFSDDGPARALRPTTLRNTRAHLRQALDAAVKSGFPLERFNTLADLIDLDVLKAVAEQLTSRNQGKTPVSLLNILATLLAIARHYVRAPEETIKSISAAKNKLSALLGGSHCRMSQKSQRRLDQFLNDRNTALLVNLPDQLMRRAHRNAGSQKAAMDALAAAAISFLLTCPSLRMANLAALQLGEDVSRQANGKQVNLLIHVAPQKTKGRRAIDAIIDPPYSTIIDQYMRSFRHQSVDSAADWVFPRRSGGPRTPDHFGEFLSKKILDETGIVMNPHLFRHLSGALYLEAHPGEYESVRRLVGHAKVDTTTSFYAPQSSRAAYERYNRVLQGYKKDGQ